MVLPPSPAKWLVKEVMLSWRGTQPSCRWGDLDVKHVGAFVVCDCGLCDVDGLSLLEADMEVAVGEADDSQEAIE